MATNFRVKMGEIDRLTFIRPLAFLNGVEYRYSDFQRFIYDEIGCHFSRLKHVRADTVTPML